MLSRKQKGFTLIELLIVVAIIGILAAIAIPNLLTAMQRSRQRRTMADMRSIATAWEARAVDLNQYNAAGFNLPGTTMTSATLEFYLAPTYIRNFATGDGWRRAWGYFADQNFTNPDGTGAKAQTYAIRSLAKDGSAQGTSYTDGPTTDFNCDIVYSNGNFIVFPEGVQQGN